MKAIQTDSAPAAIGPYSQAVVAGGFVFCSGQIALNPETMKLVNDSIEDEARQVLKNLGAVLEAAGSSVEHVVKTTIFLKDMADYATVNAIYGAFFGDTKPARATVEVARLPKDVRVEIECIAVAA
jgi:2-iminobutanoate/2-iminopropanoate deaminase